MKKCCVVGVLLAVWAGMAVADYVNPPGWESNPYFTHQIWEFDCDANPRIADHYVNQNWPVATVIDGLWMDDLGSGRQGGWLFQGPRSINDIGLVVEIPNTPNPSLVKEVWLQVTFQTNTDLTDRMQLAVLDPFGQPGTWTWDEIELLDPTQGWFRYTAIWTIFPQPALESIIVSAQLFANDFVLVDQLAVDTRCIPEPATMALLGLGALALRRRR